MEFGIHLPQFGRAASPASVREAAQHAEALGYADIWVSDHLAIPARAPYPPTAYIHEPIVTLTWAAAATERVGLGTSVLVLPLRHPVELAKMLASLDLMSSGRLIVGAAVGWLEPEFEALGIPFRERGARTDETLALLRACWNDDPVHFEGKTITASLTDMRTMPQPGRDIPIWIGGRSDAALRRAIEQGDGWHGGHDTPEAVAPLLAKLREGRPEESFALSLRLHWDGLEDDADEMRRLMAEYQALGIQHLLFQPRQRYAEDWHRAVEVLWNLAAEML
jgi:probable F420-dependent oxidoreductase